MPDLYNEDKQDTILNSVDYAVVSDTNSIEIFRVFQFYHSRWPRSLCEFVQPPLKTILNIIWKFIEFTPSLWGEFYDVLHEDMR